MATAIVFDELKTPARHGDVLIAPAPRDWARAALENHAALSSCRRDIAGRPLCDWREETRRGLAEHAEKPLIVLGHQPAFVHPGVWAKHIAADRLARALDGCAINLNVDSDEPKTVHAQVPVVDDDRLSLRILPFPDVRGSAAYEQIARQSEEIVNEFEKGLREGLGARFDRSQLPVYLEGIRGATAGDWVDQAVAGCGAINRKFGLTVREHRISRHWCTPLVCDMLLNAERFGASYNKSLQVYRQAHRIGGNRRPMPDLAAASPRFELPLWVFRPDGSRRRAFVAVDGSSLHLQAERETVAVVSTAEAAAPALLANALRAAGDVQLRPRALALTLWARLLVADLFIHGIGGAKYDQISDGILRDYYELSPPAMACASATLHLDLPTVPGQGPSVRGAGFRLRDLQWNPQRHLSRPSIESSLLDRRQAAIKHAEQLREADRKNRRARRSAFQAIREANREILARVPDLMEQARCDLRKAALAQRRRAIAEGREYFFAFFDDDRLGRLLRAIPAEADFRV